jgi:uncharacterized protein (UPF0332 family)
VTPFEFADYLDLADELAVKTDESAWRSAISRAYYAVLHAAFQALPAAQRRAISHGATHRATWQVYAASSVQGCRQIGNAGLHLRDGRVDADYRSSAQVTQPQARRLVIYARQTMERLQLYGYQR